MSEVKFFKVTVVLTAKEYATLRHEAALLGPGTVGAAIRKRLGWNVMPWGYVKWARSRGDLLDANPLSRL
jgi:hypothetical protein